MNDTNPFPDRSPRRLPARLLPVWTVLTAWWAATVAGLTETAVIAALAESLRRRFARLRATREAGLTTVEVAIITAVLLGLATALVAAITVVVNRNTGKIK
jgi:hypothetical protein